MKGEFMTPTDLRNPGRRCLVVSMEQEAHAKPQSREERRVFGRVGGVIVAHQEMIGPGGIIFDFLRGFAASRESSLRFQMH